MSVLYNDEQSAIETETRRVLDARFLPERLLALLEVTGGYDEPFWETCIEQGWTGLAVPEVYGGLDLGLVELGIVALACGAHTAGAPFLTTSYGVARAILDHGSDELKTRWLPRLACGDAIGAVAFNEGQSPLPIRPGVSFANGVLNGTKVAVSGGSRAHVALVLADRGLVIADLEHVERQTLATFDNSRCTADLVFADSPGVLLDGGHAAALEVLAHQAVVAAHEATGAAEALMHRARDYANTRQAFGQPIGAFQSVKHRIAELYGLVELARAAAIHAAARAGQPDFLTAAAAARLSAIEAYDTAARDAVQVHGGIGVTWEAGLHLHQRRARTLAVEQGNALFWEDVLADQLLGLAA